MSSARIKAPRYYSSAELKLDHSLISNAAISAVKLLNQAGYSAYLVGGCIRDLLLGIKPKDFDISTQAKPLEVKHIFSRSRVIGRRFKIVHVRIRGELLEISTYRQSAKEHHKNQLTGQVLDDNVFGTIENDAERRDFTVNALYYDVQANQVIDFFDGITDLRNRKLVLIGDCAVRFAEDPGRILRTVRFQAKFGFSVNDEVSEAVYRQKHLLNNIPPARRFDEVLKLFYCGAASRVWELLNQYGLLPYLFARSDDNESEQSILSRKITILALAGTDKRIKQNLPVISAFMFCAILWSHFHKRFDHLLAKGCDPQDAMIQASEEIIGEQLLRTGMLRRVTNTVRDIWWLQYRMEKSRNRRVYKILEQLRFRAAYDFMLIRAQVGDVDPEIAQYWTKIQGDQASSQSKKPKSSSNSKRYRNRTRGKTSS